MTFFNCFRSTMDSPSNDTWLNIIEEPSVLNHWNCSKYQILAITYGDPCLASMSCVGHVFNLLVIIVIRKSMGMNDQRTQAQIHLTSLAFSDIAVLVSANSLAIVCWQCDFCSLGSQAKHCKALFDGASLIYLLFYAVNRSMTLFISFVRSWSLMNVSNALHDHHKSQGRILIELCVFTSIITIVNGVLIVSTLYILPKWFKCPRYISFAWGGFFYSTLMIVIEFALAIFVLVKLRIYPKSIDGKKSSASEDDFERLVALVALVYCCSCLFTMIDHVNRLHADNELAAHEYRWKYWNLFSVISNSSINLIIYLIASRNFRGAVIRSGKNLKDALISSIN